MNPRDLISRYLDRWLHLTQLESKAIERADWSELSDIQTAKAALQRPLRTSLEEWNARSSSAESNGASEPFFRKMVDHLLTLENKNADLLAARKQAALERKHLAEQAARNLRLVRDSYAGITSNGWQAYS